MLHTALFFSGKHTERPVPGIFGVGLSVKTKSLSEISIGEQKISIFGR